VSGAGPTATRDSRRTVRGAISAGTDALRKGQLDEAAADFAKCIAAAPNFAEAYFDLGLVRLQQGRWDEAAALFSKSLKLKPALRGGNLLLGVARYRLDQYGAAVAAPKREVERESNNPDGLMWLGLAELASGEARSAMANLERLRSLSRMTWTSCITRVRLTCRHVQGDL
jgi:tetratricopeptide (TPR) repeat protein